MTGLSGVENGNYVSRNSEPGLLDQLSGILTDLFRSPGAFFSKQATDIPLTTAFIFALFCGSLATTATYLWSNLLPSLPNNYLKTALSAYYAEQSTTDLLWAPLSIALGTLLLAGVLHLILKLFGSARKKFPSTLRLVCLCQGAMLFNLLPYVGSLLSFVFGINFIIYGVSAVHEVSKLKTALIILSPIILSLIAAFAVMIASGVLPSLLNMSLGGRP
ncbi:MAG: YIP1 family protein [Fibrobacterota bacterium]